MIRRSRPLPTTKFRPVGRGPRLGVGSRRLDRRRAGQGWRRAILPIILLAAASSWVFVIGPDLRAGSPEKGHHKKKLRKVGAMPAAALRPAGPGHAAAPRPPPRALGPLSLRERAPVSYALLSAARDHVARRVHAAWGSVPDLEAVKGADVDLIDRGLHLAGFPLREALIRHRFKEPRRYGSRYRPQATEANRKRALTTKTLRVFLDRFAEALPTQWDVASEDSFQAGDIVLVELKNRRIRRKRKMFAVLSDRTDGNGISLLITLDPREGEARERN
ncbi:MAG: DUF1287 domain-containing protein, partial [Myxococcales bacterium]|nr:DUF1287 domain-containing protein [Myxococcales bacterium]